jgi:hypothetical protein
MNEKAQKTFLEKYWPYCLGTGIASSIYLRSRTEVSAWSVILGGSGLVLLVMGLAGLRSFNRERKISRGDDVATPQTIKEQEKPASAGDPQRRHRTSLRIGERFRSAPLRFTFVFLYVATALFEILRVPTTAGERWMWQLQFGTFDALEDVGDYYVEVKLISRSLIIREVITLAILVGLLLTCYIYMKFGSDILRFIRQNLAVLSLFIYGSALTLPLLFVPCTYESHFGIYRQVSVTHSDYRWLWKVGVADIKFGIVLLEELIVGIVATFIYLTMRQVRTNKT